MMKAITIELTALSKNGALVDEAVNPVLPNVEPGALMGPFKRI